MSAISQDLSSAGMSLAIEANGVGVFELWSRVPSMESHDDTPDVRWYTTPGVPLPLFNHVYFTRLPQEEDVDARIEEVLGHFTEHQLPFMWSVSPFSRPSKLDSHLESHGLAREEELSGMAVDLTALNEDIPFPSGLTIEWVSNAEVLREVVEIMRVDFEMPQFAVEGLFEVLSALGLTDESPWRNYVGRLDGEAVTTASLAFVAGVAGLYNVATLPKVRRRGLGTAMTIAALREARELGYRIGIL
jgi:hypothetical protein